MFDWLRLPRRHVLAGSAGLGAATLAGPRLAGAQDAKVAKVRFVSDIKVIEPAGNFVVDEQSVIYATQRGLIRHIPGEAWQWGLDAAESIEQVDPTHVKFTLKKGIMFSGGYGEMTTEDVKYSFDRMASEALQATDRQEFEQYETVEIVDSHTGVLVTKAPMATMFTTFLTRYFCTIVSKKAWEEKGGATVSLGTDIPTFSGPYVLKEWVPQQKIVLARNAEYLGDPAPFDEVQCLIIEDDKAAELAYQAGEVDVTRVSIGSAAEFKKDPPADTQVVIRPTTGFVWLGINVQHEPYADIKVRQAIRKAIDVQQIIDAAYFGVPSPSTGIIAPGLMGWRDAAVEPRDVEGAKALLAEAGLGDGFSTTITCLNSTEDTTAAQVIQAQLAEIGVQAEVMSYEEGVYWNLGLESQGEDWKNLQLVLQDWTSAADPRRATMWFVTSQVGEWNWQRWSNARYDELDAAAALETDPEARAAMYREMMDIQHNDAAFINITHRPWVVLVRNTIVPNAMPNGYVEPRWIGAA
ncbi:MAG: peptide ABC transporter substrate-binding protein [Alphaproteobacteria bacterium]|nr:peptide ABC transporter substrate-binding protein [Alphaproteobacteria bacterium]